MEELLRVLEWPQVHAELLMPAKWPDYSYPEGQKLLRDRVGAARLKPSCCPTSPSVYARS